MATRRRRKAPSLAVVQRELAEVMDLVRHYVLEPHRAGEDVDPGHLSRLATAYVQIVQTYLKVAESAELQPQIEAIRDELREIRQGALRA